MAMTFSAVTQRDPVAGSATLTMTTDTNSAAGSFTLGFMPSSITVWDITTQLIYDWTASFAAAGGVKHADAGTLSVMTAGFTVTGPDSTPPTLTTITFGTDMHTNSCTYHILCRR